MEKVFRYIFFLIMLLYKTNVNCLSESDINPNTDSTLIGIITIINHGASTPTSYYDKMKYVFSPNPNGVLTAIGAKQMKILGSYIRKKYFSSKNNLLDRDKNNNYLAMSLGLPRCINSAISNLQTIFSKDLVAFRNYQLNEERTSIKRSNLGNYFDYNDYINKTEENKIKDVMINFMDSTGDKLLSPRKCFRFNKTFTIENTNNHTHELNESEIDLVIKNLNSTFPNLTTELIDSDYNTEKMTNIYDYLNSIDHHYPELFTSQSNLTRVLAKYKMKHHYQYLKDDDEVKLLSSNLFDMFLATFDKLINVEEGNLRKIGHRNNYNSLFIFGEERNIIDIFNNLIDSDYIKNLIESDSEHSNYLSELLPPFASHVVFELRKYEEIFYVKIIYNGEEIFVNSKKLKGLPDRTVTYDSKNGMRYEDFKLLLLSRINKYYKKFDCK